MVIPTAEFVSNPEKPEGSMTGFTNFDPKLARQQLELLKQVVPSAKRIAFLGDEAVGEGPFKPHEGAARALGLEPLILKLRGPARCRRRVSRSHPARQPPTSDGTQGGGLTILGSATTSLNLTVAGTFSTKRSGRTVYADQFPGDDAGEKIAAAIGINFDNIRKDVVVKGLSGDNNQSLVRINGQTSLRIAIIGIKAETTTGVQDPVVLIDSETNACPAITLIGSENILPRAKSVV